MNGHDLSMFWDRLSAALADVAAEEQQPPPQARGGAVLVLIEDSEEGPRFILTRRRQDLRSHPGQISFPGGRIDAGESVEQAALREATEEIGLDPASVEIVGIDRRFYLEPSRFWVVPVIARWRRPHPLEENPWEVDRILRIAVTELMDERRMRHVRMAIHSHSWAWQLDEGDLLWGATARVVADLLDIAVTDWSQGRTPEGLAGERSVRPWDRLPPFPRRRRLPEDLPTYPQASLPHVTTDQIRSLRDWLDQRGFDTAARSEQAARGLADAVAASFEEGLVDRRITVLAGPSSNGAGGRACARLLAARGAQVDVVSVGAPRLPAQQQMLRDVGIKVHRVTRLDDLDALTPGELVVDAMLGIGAQPPLRDLPATVSRWMRHYDVPIVALDVPSGLSADEGLKGACLNVDVTVACGLPTAAFAERLTQPFVGDLFVADLGIPAAAWAAVGVTVPADLFSDGPLVRLLPIE